MDRWQYRIVNVGAFNAAERMVAAFGALGAQGWELVGMYDKSSNWFSGMEKGFALFKRAVPAGSEPEGAWAAAFSAGAFTGAEGASDDGTFGGRSAACAQSKHRNCWWEACGCECHDALPDGEWSCRNCGARQLSTARSCDMCGTMRIVIPAPQADTPKAPLAAADQWACSGCGARQAGSARFCDLCGTTRVV